MCSKCDMALCRRAGYIGRERGKKGLIGGNRNGGRLIGLLDYEDGRAETLWVFIGGAWERICYMSN